MSSPLSFFMRFICWGTLALCVGHCTEVPISQLSPEEGIQRIRSAHKEEHFDEVVQNVSEYRSRHPYTPFLAEADLRQADSYFQSKKYAEAIVSYEEFIKKNPNHSDAPLSWFRIAQSYDKQSPEEVDREQGYAITAGDRYEQFLKLYPQSTFASEAKNRASLLRRRVADHNLFVARYYWRKEIWGGALNRYLAILRTYGNYEDLANESRERAAACYTKMAKLLQDDPKSDQLIYFKGTTAEELLKKASELNNNNNTKKP